MESSVNRKKVLKWVGIIVGIPIIAWIFLTQMFFFNEANHQTYVRGLFGGEYVYDTPGYKPKYFGRTSTWTDALTIQTSISAETDTNPQDGKVVIPAFEVQFLNNTGRGTAESSTRFRLPKGEQFLELVREYRTQENFVSTILNPALRVTLNNTASLMTADDYYGGAKGEFNNEYDNQMKNGIYIVKRVEQRQKALKQAAGRAIAQDGIDQGQFGEQSSSYYVTQKQLDKNGMPLRKLQDFARYGVTIETAQVMNVEPDDTFKERIKKIQDSQATLMIARQDRLKEEEAKKLATAKGEKEVEERRQATLKNQIEKTTNAETAKRLALIDAEKQEEQAKINNRTAVIDLDTAKTKAQATKVTADAEAYQKRVIIEADGALAQKLEALKEINAVWANAATKAPVPQVVMGGTGGNSRQSEIGEFMQLMNAKAAKDLAIDMRVK